MLAEDRRNKILEQLYAKGTVRTSALVERLDVSEVTVRADLQELERQGRLLRIRGGATTARGEYGGPFEERLMRNKSAKDQIALAASALVEHNQTVAFDAGTTVLALARRVPPVSGLTIVTPALNTAQQLLGVEGVDVVMLSGPIDPETISATWSGPGPGEPKIIGHQLFMGAHGIDSDFDIVDVNKSAAAVKQRLMAGSRRIILLADSSKFLVEAPIKVASLTDVDIVITDSGMADDVKESVARAGVRLIVAGET